MPEYERNLKPDLMDAKLNYIHLRWGLDKAELDSLIESNTMKGISRNAKTKFRRYLNSLEQVLGALSKEYQIEDKMKTDPFVQDYSDSVRKQLGNEAKFLSYLTGSWDDEILRAVSIAQKHHMVAQRVRTMSGQQPRASFAPYSQYRKYFNK
jgi:hypothetical protein